MSLVRYEPWRLMNQLHHEFDRLLDTRGGRLSENDGQLATSDWVPAVDIREENERFVIHADVPGVNPADIELDMADGVLTIKGERKSESKEEREGYKRMERVRGSFLRRFSLPDTVKADAISARVAEGVLEIVIPKQEQLQPRRIQVKG